VSLHLFSSVAVILPLRARELPSNFFRFSVLLFTKTSSRHYLSPDVSALVLV